jgi:hypothetical protein
MPVNITVAMNTHATIEKLWGSVSFVLYESEESRQLMLPRTSCPILK